MFSAHKSLAVARVSLFSVITEPPSFRLLAGEVGLYLPL